MFYFFITLLASPFIYILTAIRKSRGLSHSDIKTSQSEPDASQEDDFQRILVIQTAKIGDLICTTPVFREIRLKYPKAHITVAVNPVAREIIEHNPHINEIIPIASKNFTGLGGKAKLGTIFRTGNFDTALILLPNLPNILGSFWGLIPTRVSIFPENAGSTLKLCSIFASYLETHQPGELVSQTYLRALRFLDIQATNTIPEVFAAPGAKQAVENFCQKENVNENLSLVGISVSCGNKLKEWGQEKFAGLADLILEHHQAQILFIGAETDKQAAVQIQKLMRGKAVNSCGGFSLEELPALLAKLKLFIGVDTGIAYMAAASGVPVVNIAGPCNMQDQRPQGAQCEIIQKELPCIPCSSAFSVPSQCEHGNRECLELISVDEVMQRVHKLLDPNNVDSIH